MALSCTPIARQPLTGYVMVIDREASRDRSNRNTLTPFLIAVDLTRCPRDAETGSPVEESYCVSKDKGEKHHTHTLRSETTICSDVYDS